MKYVGESIWGMGFIFKILQPKKKKCVGRRMRNRWKNMINFFLKTAESGFGTIFSVAWDLTIKNHLLEKNPAPISDFFCEDSTNTHKALSRLADSRASQPRHDWPLGLDHPLWREGLGSVGCWGACLATACSSPPTSRDNLLRPTALQ